MKKPRETASQLYARNRKLTLGLIAELQSTLAKHDGEQAEEPKHYGFAGDLEHANQNLAEIIMFLLPSNDPAKKTWGDDSEAEGMKALLNRINS